MKKPSFKKIIPYALVFHPRGLFGKFGPYIAIMLFVAALPFLLSSTAREKVTTLITDSAPQTQPRQSQPQVPPDPMTGFDPLALQGAWAVSQTDADRATMSWSAAKNRAADIWDSQPGTPNTYSSFYCGCTITRSGSSGGDVDLNSCGYETRGNLNRARRLEWEHIMPASYFGAARQCWTRGAPQCVDSQGQAFAGRSCCEIADPLFQMMSNDPVNLVPSIGEVNGDRSNYPFTQLGGRGESYGQCTMRVDTDLDLVEPPAHRRGDIARVYAYMSRAYGVTLPAGQAELYARWIQEDPVSQEEIIINQAIQATGQRANPFVLGE